MYFVCYAMLPYPNLLFSQSESMSAVLISWQYQVTDLILPDFWLNLGIINTYNHTFLVCFGKISGSFCLTMGFLAPLRLPKTMAQPNLPSVWSKHAKNV